MIKDVLMHEKKKLSEAILQVIYTTTEPPIQSWVRGSCFVLGYKEKLFIVTASHCIEDNELDKLFLGKMATKRTLYSIPIQTQIKSYDTRYTKVDTDLRIFKVNDEEFNNNILKNAQIKTIDEYCKEIRKTPLFNRMARRYKNNHTKLMEKITQTKLYKTLYQKQNSKNNEAIKNANTSLAEIKNLKLANKDFIYKAGIECQIYGYSISKGQIKYDENGVFVSAHQVLIQLLGKLTGEYNNSSQTYIVKYENNEDLDGISGGPVIADGKVIGVCSFVEEKNKILHFIPVEDIKRSIDFWFNQQNKT